MIENEMVCVLCSHKLLSVEFQNSYYVCVNVRKRECTCMFVQGGGGGGGHFHVGM